MADLIIGRNPVLEALKADRPIDKLLIAQGVKGGSIDQIRRVARNKGIVVQEVDRKKLDSLTPSTSHQGIVAYASPKEYVDVEDILSKAESMGEDVLILLLDQIEDPHNLGAILRTADAVGVHGVVIPKRRAAGLTETVVKASAGAVEYIDVAKVANLVQTIDYLKEKGVWVVGTDAVASKTHWEEQLTGPLAIVVGSEGKGMSRLIKEKCDYMVNIPMLGRISSLNASVAASLLMYEVLRQRRIRSIE